MTVSEIKALINHYVTTIKGSTPITGYRLNWILNKMMDVDAAVVGDTSLVFRGLLDQTGDTAPNLIALYNTLGITLTPSRVTVGSYELTDAGGNAIFDPLKTFVQMTPYKGDDLDVGAMVKVGAFNDVISILTSEAGVLADGVLGQAYGQQYTSIEIRVYE